VLRAAGALGCAVVVPVVWSADAAEPQVLAALREGGVAVLLRHASAPGTFDPPEFRLGDCGTQRNLDPSGREQARRIGAWFRAQGLAPAAVRSSPWCRCLDTARLAFGDVVQAWPALGSVRMAQDRDAQASELRRALAGVRAGGFEVWVTHQFTIGALVPASTASGEGVVLRAGADGDVPQVVGRLAPARARATAATAGRPALPIIKVLV
jgi:phosphohistidine phosphatase SixA